MQYRPGVNPDSMTPSPLMRICRASALILSVYRMCGLSSLKMGCIALSCRCAEMMNGSMHACVLSLHTQGNS
jgi:hypothetical protein